MDNHWLDELQRVRSEDRRFYERYVLGAWHPPEEKRLPDERVLELTIPRKAEFVSIEETLLMAFELVEARRRRALLPPELISNERVLELAESYGTKILEPSAAYRDVAILLRELLSRRNQQ